MSTSQCSKPVYVMPGTSGVQALFTLETSLGQKMAVGQCTPKGGGAPYQCLQKGNDYTQLLAVYRNTPVLSFAQSLPSGLPINLFYLTTDKAGNNLIQGPLRPNNQDLGFQLRHTIKSSASNIIYQGETVDLTDGSGKVLFPKVTIYNAKGNGNIDYYPCLSEQAVCDSTKCPSSLCSDPGYPNTCGGTRTNEVACSQQTKTTKQPTFHCLPPACINCNATRCTTNNQKCVQDPKSKTWSCQLCPTKCRKDADCGDASCKCKIAAGETIGTCDCSLPVSQFPWRYIIAGFILLAALYILYMMFQYRKDVAEEGVEPSLEEGEEPPLEE